MFENMIPTPRLSLDIFYVMIEFLGLRELALFSAVCKLYHGPALNRLLSSGIKLSHNSQLTQFCACILSDPVIRGSRVKTLDIHETAFQWRTQDDDDELSTSQIADFSSVSMLTVVLEHCSRLTTLRIRMLDELLYAIPRLGTAIASLRCLTELDVKVADESEAYLIADLICSMQSQLRILQLHYDPDWSSPDFPLRDPAAFTSTANIEDLVLTNFIFPPIEAQYSPWLSVRRVTFFDCPVDLDHMPSVIPNVQVCKLDKGVEVVPRQVGLPLWQRLDTLQVDVGLLNELEWRGCPVRWLDLTAAFEIPSNPNQLPGMINLVRECQPLVLSLQRVLDAQLGLQFWHTLHVATQNLRCLQFTMSLQLILDPIAYITCLLWSLADLPLVYLDISIEREPNPQVSSGHTLFPPYLREAFARRIRTLQVLALSQSEYTVPNHTTPDWWLIIRPGMPDGQAKLELLAQTEGENLKKRIWDMDRASLLHFDIDNIMAQQSWKT